MGGSATSIGAGSAFGSTAGSDGMRIEGGLQVMTSSGGLPGQTATVLSSSTGGLFGIFDGHGGIEVAEFCSRHFEAALKANPHY